MKKTALLNAELSGLIAALGHNDMLIIGDAGLPVPPQTRRIDLALTRGVPGFLETVRVIVEEMQVEQVILAEETKSVSPHIESAVRTLLPNAKYQTVTHEELKALCKDARAVVRTGEFTPYANVILKSGVVF